MDCSIDRPVHLLYQENQSSLCDVIDRPEHPSINHVLHQQFEEQSSSLCDVIIKVGSWEKRFHRCVLVASPYFEAICRSDFIEKGSEIIELNRWPASLLEPSLLCLYGRKPVVTESNVDELFDIAEFLLIPELKRACVDFLRRTDVTVDNCMHLLELSRVYEFDLVIYKLFILCRLPQFLEHEGMLNVTAESIIKMLLSDHKYCYTSVQDWFNFLIRWVQKVPGRFCQLVDLLHMLDFGGCDSNVINTTVAREPLVAKHKDELEELLTLCKHDDSDTVVLFQVEGIISLYPLTCLNLRTNVLHRIDMDIDDMTDPESHIVRGVKNSTSSCIYKVHQDNLSFRVITHDLSNARSSVSTVVIGETGEIATPSNIYTRTYSLANDTLAAVFYDAGENVTDPSCVHSRTQYQVWNESTLNIGKLGERITVMHAVLTLRNHYISDVCCEDNGTIAMLTSDRDHLFIFDESAGELECVQLGNSFRCIVSSIHLAAFRDGFVLYDEDSVLCISRVSENVWGPKYVAKLRMWEKCVVPSWPIKFKYYFDGHRWYRYSECEGSLEFVSHEDLITIADTRNLPWIQVRMPYYYWNPPKLFAVRVPTGILRCHSSCYICDASVYGHGYSVV